MARSAGPPHQSCILPWLPSRPGLFFCPAGAVTRWVLEALERWAGGRGGRVLQEVGRTALCPPLPEPWGARWGGCPCASPQYPAVMAASRQDSLFVRLGSEQSVLSPGGDARGPGPPGVFCSLCSHCPGNPTGEPAALLWCWLEKS